MDVLAQNSGIASLVIGACGTAIAVATVAVRILVYVFKKRKRIIEPVRRLLKHLHETTPRENEADEEEIQTLEDLQNACDFAAQNDDMDSVVSSMLMLLSPEHAGRVLTSAHYLVASYSEMFEHMREQKNWIGTGASVEAISSTTESVISVVDFVHRAIRSGMNGNENMEGVKPLDVLQKIYHVAGDGVLTPQSANEVLKRLVVFLGSVIQFDRLITNDDRCPERYSIWKSEDDGTDMSLYLVKVRDEIRDVLYQDIRPYRLEGGKTRRAAIISESMEDAETSEPSKKRSRAE